MPERLDAHSLKIAERIVRQQYGPTIAAVGTRELEPQWSKLLREYAVEHQRYPITRTKLRPRERHPPRLKTIDLASIAIVTLQWIVNQPRPNRHWQALGLLRGCR
jgi:hypothetical protein